MFILTLAARCRISFETERIEEAEDRLNSLQKAVISEKRKLETLDEQKAALESIIKELEESAESAKAVLAELQETSSEAQANLDKVKKTNSKASKAYDRAIKEVAALNDSIEKLASERLTIYKRCKLEEIDLPLKKGSLDSVPLDEVSFQRENLS
jgi:structural maintenance of chromosome 1